MRSRGSSARVVASIVNLTLIALVARTAIGDAATIEFYYGPDDLPGQKFVWLYDRAQRYIHVAMYGLMYPAAVHALLRAKKRGVDIRIITDREKLKDPKQRAALHTLLLGDIPIRGNAHDALMHLKIIVVDDCINTSGSMNLTTSGHAFNDERLDIIRDALITAKARDKFLAVWRDPVRYERWVE